MFFSEPTTIPTWEPGGAAWLPGTRTWGCAEIHNIQNSPFRTKFEGILDEMTGTAAIGCISDTDPQPILIRSRLGIYAICTIGVINNAEALIANHLHTTGGHFDSMTGGPGQLQRADCRHD